MRPQLLPLILALFLMSCQSPIQSNEQVQFLYFDGCPNTPLLYERLVEACPDSHIERIDLTTLSDGDRLLGWGAPTILVQGKDLCGLEPSNSKSISCRNWSHGLPSVSDIKKKVSVIE
tara:strand:- start:325 stop:678 length:354 start_codon:yes stop_codon:yes gene_type:complete